MAEPLFRDLNEKKFEFSPIFNSRLSNIHEFNFVFTHNYQCSLWQNTVTSTGHIFDEILLT